MEYEKRAARYAREFKEQAIALGDTGEKPVGQIEAELGIGRGQISRWRRERAKNEERHGSRDQVDLEAENRRLRKENAEVRGGPAVSVRCSGPVQPNGHRMGDV